MPKICSSALRGPADFPRATVEWGWRYHHLGCPTDRHRPGEIHLPHLKISVSGFETNPLGIEWMRFDPDCPMPDPIKTAPHLAFVVNDLESALRGWKILVKPNRPSPGVRVAMVLCEGVPIELMEFEDGGKSFRD